MKLEYQSLKEAEKSFKWSERWEVFDDPEHLNIAYECVDRHPKEKIAIRIHNSDGSKTTVTFGELSRLTSQFAHFLEKSGIKPGDRVGIILNPCLEYYVSFYGTLKRGAVAVPCYALLGPEGIAYRLKDSKAKIAIIAKERTHLVGSDVAQRVLPAEELLGLIKNESPDYKPNTSVDTLALIQFSSGTTGQPKQVLYNHAAVSVTAVFVKFWLGVRANDNVICTSSPAWGHGIWYGTVGPLIYGNGVNSFGAKFDPVAFLKFLQDYEITVVSAIPRVYKMIMECGKIDDFKLKLRRLTYSGGGIEKETQQYFLEKRGLHIASVYGNTESGPIVVDYAFEDYIPRVGSAGKAMLGVKVAILDENGKELPPGQVGEVATWRKGGWNKIGDYAYFDEEGYCWPQGRSDDVIKSSGFRIGPFEIENVLEKYPGVQQAAVVGSPDKERGEIVKAFIVLKPDAQPSQELISNLQDLVKKNLSMHEYPKEIEFVTELPETPDGKLQRKVLKKKEYEKKGKKLT